MILPPLVFPGLSLLGAPPYARLQALPTNIRLGLKGLSGTNTLAYHENP